MSKRTSLAVAGLGLALLAFGPPTHLRADEGGTDLPFEGDAAGVVTGVAPSGAAVVESTGIATHLRLRRPEPSYARAVYAGE